MTRAERLAHLLAEPTGAAVAAVGAWRHAVDCLAAVPWAGEPRFVCDTNLEGLARQLRMCGLDATSAPLGARNQRFLVHRRAGPCWVARAARAV